MTQTRKPSPTAPIENVAALKPEGTEAPVKPVFRKPQGTEVEFPNAPYESRSSTYQLPTGEYAGDPSKYTSLKGVTEHQANTQPISDKIGRSLTQFGTNFVSGLGQGIANMTDISSWGNDSYQSSLFGVTTKEMQDWAQGIAENNQIYEKDPGGTDLTDFGWWAKQFASAGTGLGMGVLSVAETAGIEALTGGAGTGVALARLGRSIRGIAKGVSGVERATEALNIAKGMKSAATIYGVLNRTNESRMEAMGTYDEIYQEMKGMKKADGTPKYTDDEAKQFAAEGADITFAGNMALLPLDILSYRMMVFNPVSGAAESALERGIAKLPKLLGKPLSWGIEVGSEGVEEGAQFIAGEEGKHYAKVLGGLDDGTSFMERVGADMKTNEFWNNFAGGVVGAPVLGFIMKGANRIMAGNRSSILKAQHDDHVKNVSKMDNYYAGEIRKAEEAGDIDKATQLRRAANGNQTLAGLGLDDATGRDTAYSSRLTFLEGTLEELKQGKTDSLRDLGHKVDPANTDQMEKLKADFTGMVEDTKSIKSIYDAAKNQYEQSVLPMVVNTKFNINNQQKSLAETNVALGTLRASMPEFNELSAPGREMFNILGDLPSLNANRKSLAKLVAQTDDVQEKAEYQKVLDQTTKKITDLSQRKDEIEADKDYTNEMKEHDLDITNSIMSTEQSIELTHKKNILESQISLGRKQLGLYGDKKYVGNAKNRAIAKGKASAATAASVAADPKESAANKQAANDATIKTESDRIWDEQVRAQQAAAAAANANQTNTNVAQNNAPVVQGAQVNAAMNKTTPGAVPGNDNFFGDPVPKYTVGQETQNALSTAANSMNSNEPVVKQGLTEAQIMRGGVEEDITMLFAPKSLGQVEAHTTKVFANAVNVVMAGLPSNQQTFSDMLGVYIQVRGKEEADANFNALTKGWEASGRVPENYQTIYSQTFTPLNDALAALNAEVERIAVKQDAKETAAVVATTGMPVAYDTNNQPLYQQEGSKDDGDKKVYSTMAFTNTRGQYKLVENEQGVKVATFFPTSEELMFGTDIDNRALLDPDRFREGTELVALIPHDHESIEVPIFNSEGEKIRTMPFGQWMAEGEAAGEDRSKGSPAWVDKVPMKIFEKGQQGGKGVAFVHDTGWYHIFQHGSNPMNNKIKQDKTRNIRQAIASSPNESAEMVVTFKTETTVDDLKLKDDITIPISEANPDTVLVIASDKGLTLEDKGTNYLYAGKRMLHPGKPNNGQYYGVVRYGTQDGEPTYLLQIIYPQLLGKTVEILNTLKNFASIRLDMESSEDAKKAIREITKKTGIDVGSRDGVSEFLKQFLPVQGLTGSTDVNSARQQIDHGKNKIRAGSPYVVVLSNGNIAYGIKGDNGYIHEVTTHPQALAFAKFAKDIKHNIGFDAIRKGYGNKSNQVVYLSKTAGQTAYQVAPQGNYNDYIKTKVNSNLQSINIGTAENPKYVSQIQPSIGIELKENYVPQEVNVKNTVEIIKQEEAKQDEPIKKAEEQSKEATDKEERIKAKRAARQANINKSLNMQGGEVTGKAELDIQGTTDFEAPRSTTQAEREAAAQQINRIAGLTSPEQTAVINFIFQQIVGKVKEGDISKEALHAAIQEVYNDIFQKSIGKSKGMIKVFEEELGDEELGLTEEEKKENHDHILGHQMQIRKLENVIASFDQVYDEVNRVIKKEKLIDNNVMQKFVEDDNPTEANPDLQVIDVDTPADRDFGVSSLQINPELRVSAQLRLLFEGIQQRLEDGTAVTGPLGLLEYVNSGEILRYLQNQLVNIEPSRTEMYKKLEKLQTSRPWMAEVIKKLTDAPMTDQLAFVKAMSNNPHRPKFVMYTLDRNSDSYTVKIMDSHLNGLEGRLWKDWMTNFKTKSGIVVYKDDQYQIDETKRASLKKRIIAIKDLDRNPKNYKILHQLFHDLGVTVDERTSEKIFTKGLYANYKEQEWNDLFKPGGLFTIMENELNSFKKEQILLDKSPISNSIFKAIAKEDAVYSSKESSTNFRENGKSFFGLVTPKYAFDTAVELAKEDSMLRRHLLSHPFSKNSMILKLLSISSKFREQFSVDPVGDMAIKLNGRDAYGDKNVGALSPLDLESTKLGGFTYMQQGKVEYDTMEGVPSSTYEGTNIPMRIAMFFMPTMSDKSLALWLKTAALDFREVDLIDEDNQGGVSDEVLKVMYEQLVKPELERMIASSGETTNINGYDKGKHLFLGLSAMNGLMYGNIKLTDHLKNNGDKTSTRIQDIEKNKGVMDQIYEILQTTVKDQALKKQDEWDAMGLTPRDEQRNVTNLNNFDGAVKDGYLTKFQRVSRNDAVRLAAIDYTINSMIHNMNAQMIIAGDPAMYYKSKATDATKANMDTYDNISKRYAGLIAPAIPYPDGKDKTFLQVFLKDRTTIPDAKYLKMVTRLQDGKEITDKEIESLWKAATTQGADKETMALLKSDRDSVLSKFPKSSVFFEIEGTDAQEYTTWREHLEILQAYAHMPDTGITINQADIDAARKIFVENKERSKLSKAELEIISKVMQPLKPRYFGRKMQEGLSRMVYIKTSSFPLIPQLTQGFEIDKLRKLLEDKEKEGLKVRASYQSGNKVGSVADANTLHVWNDDGSFRDEAIKELGDANSMVLDRKGWGIQQEVPFKSEKPKEDKVRVMTQLMKLMFGDGIMNTGGFNFEGGDPKSGAEMQDLYNKMFLELFDIKRQNFNQELGLEGHGQIPEGKDLQVAKKLQKLLREEAEKRGYPLNDIIGLGLDEQGNFNMPLWASANVNRFESLLNSIVDNAMVKIKFPGYSYVAGTNEGFRSPKVTEEQDADLKASEVIYTKHWNGSHLQMTSNAGGVLQKAQVFLPSKFKDAKGKLIDLFARKKNADGTQGDYIYVVPKGDNGFELKPGAIDDDLLSILTCRIPTSSLASSATVEIAGFLPANSGDLVIVPAEFTKQKGMDFDVDKEYSYHYHHVVGADGKISKVDKLYEGVDINELIKEMEELQPALHKELGLERRENRKKLETLQAAIDVRAEEGLEPIAATMEKIAEIRKKGEDKEKSYRDTFSVLAELKEHKEKMLVNRLINLMQAVLENPSDEVQSKINNALTIQFEKDEANAIDKLVNQQDPLFTGLSDMLQTKQFFSGVAGKIGTAIYSLDVVFHSQAQQSALNGRPLRLGKDKTWDFGDVASSNTLGNQMTNADGFQKEKGKRSITEVNSGQQNASLDNAKENILGKVNLNPTTMDVDKVFNLLGLDESGGKKLSYYFLSQPILRDYVMMMQNSGSVLADYQADRDEAVYNALMAKYSPNYKDNKEEDDLHEQKMGRALNIEDLEVELDKDLPGVDGDLQMMVLDRFLDMKPYGLSIRKIQVALNTDSQGLNKSFFNVIERMKTLDSLPDMPLIENAGALVGDYKPIDEDMSKEQIADYEKQGYVRLPFRTVDSENRIKIGGKYLIRPTTISGKVAIQSLMTAYNLYNNYLPYDSVRFNQIFNELLPAIEGKNPGEASTVELKQEILQDMKKYLGVVDGNGIIYGENLTEYRKELYIDSDDNVSLAKYLRELMDWPDKHPIIDNYIKKNTLLNKLEFDVNIDGTPSLIKYNNATGESFDEQELHNSFYQLLSINYKLPKIGNKQYTTSELAQAMITYSHLGNMIQEAIQFTKFLPAEYYNQFGYTTFMKNLHGGLVADMENDNVFKVYSGSLTPSRFAIQYIQHNPARVKYKLPNKHKELSKKITGENEEYGKVTKEGKDTDISKLTSFKLKGEDMPKFITIYNKKLKGKQKQQVYVRHNDLYRRIEVLGTFGMDEYDPSEPVGTTLVNDKVPIDLSMSSGVKTPIPVVDTTDQFQLKTGNPTQILEAIGNANLSKYSDLARALIPHITPALKVKMDAINANGTYTRETDTIVIDQELYYAGDNEVLAKIVLHEFIHSVTVKQLEKYLRKKEDGSYEIMEGAPAYINKLFQLFNTAVEHFGQEEVSRIRAKYAQSRKGGENLSEKEIATSYGVTSIFEFMTLAMTEPEFQKELDGVKFKATNETLLDRFKNIIKSMLSHLGVEFDPQGVTAQTIDTIMELVETEAKIEKEERSKYQKWADEAAEIKEGMSPSDILKKELGVPVEFTPAEAANYLGEPSPRDEEVKLPLVVETANLVDGVGGKILATSRKSKIGTGYTIYVNEHIGVDEFFNYILGNDDSETSQQKRMVLEAYAKAEGRTSANGIVNMMKAFLNTPAKIKQFLVLHEQSHIDHDDFAVLWNNGIESLLTPDKIAIELRATKDAMDQIAKEEPFHPKSAEQEFPNKPLKVKTQKCY